MTGDLYCDLFLYADDSCLVYEHNNIRKVNKNATITLHILQNKFIWFYLNLNNRAHIGLLMGFEKINWLLINNLIDKCVSQMTSKYFSNLSPAYMNDVFKTSGQNSTTTKAFLLKLNQPLQKTKLPQNNLSQIYSIKYLE